MRACAGHLLHSVGPIHFTASASRKSDRPREAEQCFNGLLADKDGEDDGRGQSAQPRCSPEARPQERGHGTHTLRCCRCTCRGQETQGLWAREEPADGGEHLAPQACPRASPPTRSSTAAAIPAPPANLSTTDVRKSGGRGRLAIFSHSRCRQEQEMRLKKLDCERNMCSHLEGESKLNCNYKCISEPCYSEIYGHDEVPCPSLPPPCFASQRCRVRCELFVLAVLPPRVATRCSPRAPSNFLLHGASPRLTVPHGILCSAGGRGRGGLGEVETFRFLFPPQLPTGDGGAQGAHASRGRRSARPVTFR